MDDITNIQEKVRTIEELLSYLVKNNYPPESLATYWEKDNHIYDLAIIHPETREVVAIIELNIKNKLMSSSAGLRKTIASYLKLKKETNIPLFHVEKYHSGLKIYQFVSPDNSEKGTFIPLRKIPNYEDIKLKSLGEKRKTAMDKIQIICCIFGIIVFGILIADIFNLYKFTTIQMGFLVLTIVLFLIPYSNKLKIFNIEFERKN